MSRSGVFDRRDALLDLAGLSLLGAVSLALAALPFAVGAMLGVGLVYLAILRSGWRGPALLVTGLAALIVSSGSLLSLPGASAPWLFWEPADLAWKLAFGFLLGFGTMVLAQIPEPFAPASWQKTIEQRRHLAHATLVVGGVLEVL